MGLELRATDRKSDSIERRTKHCWFCIFMGFVEKKRKILIPQDMFT